MSENNDVKTERTQDKSKGCWLIELDTSLCTLCEACARKCPTEALQIEKDDGKIKLLFTQIECIGCTGDTACVALCPEDAIVLREAGKPDDEGIVDVLVEGELIQCEYCKEYFTSSARIERLRQKGLGHEVNTKFCPLCRRTDLVVQLIDHDIAPGKDAMYRSTNDIIRRARFRLHEENDGKNPKE